MLWVLAVAGILGWLGHRARVQRDAVVVVQRAGARVYYDWEWKNHRPAPGAAAPWRRFLIEHLGPDMVGTVKGVRFERCPIEEVDDAFIEQVGGLH